MSDKDSNYDLNDELLSAYLDGELSADQRAAVEARVASDPAC
jgi:anti-sigma factor RsiW